MLSPNAWYYKRYSVRSCCNHFLAVEMSVPCRGVVVYVWLKKWQKIYPSGSHFD